MAGGVEGRGDADHVAVLRRCRIGLQGGRQGAFIGTFLADLACGRAAAAADEGFGVEVGQVFLCIVPLLRGFADQPADVGAGGAAFDLAVEDQSADHRRGVAGGVAGLHPAGRLGADAVVGDVLVILAGVVPEELAVIGAQVHVEFEVHRFDLHRAFDRMNDRPGGEHCQGVGLGEAFPDQRRIPCAAVVAGAQHDAAGAGQTHAIDQLAAQRTEAAAVHQQHARAVQPDAPVAGAEQQGFGQVLQGGGGAWRQLLAGATGGGFARIAGEFGQGNQLVCHRKTLNRINHNPHSAA